MRASDMDEPVKEFSTLTTSSFWRAVDAEAGGLAADSLAPRRVGEIMFPIAQRHVSRVVLVTDEAIRHAQQTLWNVVRVVAEPGGAARMNTGHEGGERTAANDVWI